MIGSGTQKSDWSELPNIIRDEIERFMGSQRALSSKWPFKSQLPTFHTQDAYAPALLIAHPALGTHRLLGFHLA